jgi:nitrite reductase (NO-forming)
MQGQFLVTPMPAAQTLVEADISREPTDLPPPIGKRDAKTVRLDLFTVEQEGRLAEATTFGYWTFNGKVPGPFVRVRVGDTVDVHLKNSADNNMIHSVDFHAATGPGGGAAALQVDPGAEKSMTFKALIPGLYVYQRHVWLDPGRTRSRPCSGRSRILCHARRNLYGGRVRSARKSGVQRREAIE